MPKYGQNVGSVRVGESLARVLRERIMKDEFTDGTLPKQEELMKDFGVSAPSVREAFRVLESEGLITVRRGNVGGAIVHVPDASTTAHAVGLALQSERVSLKDVSVAICHLDAIVAGMCASRSDRKENVVPVLLEEIARSEAADVDAEVWPAASTAFHLRLSELSGNSTLDVILKSLYALWDSHQHDWTTVHSSDEYLDAKIREQILADHRALVKLIAEGDVEGVHAASHIHMAEALTILLQKPEVIVSVTHLR